MPEKEGAEEKTTKSVVNKKQKQMMGEEGYDHLRDQGRIRKNKKKKDATTMPPSKEMEKTRKVNKGPSALEIVKKKYKGQIMDVKKEELDLTQVAEAFGGYIVEKTRKSAKSLTGNIPPEERGVQPDADKITKKRIKKAQSQQQDFSSKMREIEGDPQTKKIKAEVEKASGQKTREFTQTDKNVTRGNELKQSPVNKKPIKGGSLENVRTYQKTGDKLVDTTPTPTKTKPNKFDKIITNYQKNVKKNPEISGVRSTTNQQQQKTFMQSQKRKLESQKKAKVIQKKLGVEPSGQGTFDLGDTTTTGDPISTKKTRRLKGTTAIGTPKKSGGRQLQIKGLTKQGKRSADKLTAKGLERVRKKVATSAAKETAKKATQSVAVKQASKQVAKGAAKTVVRKAAAKGAAKFAAKRIPGIGAAISGAEAIGRAAKGDYVGAAIAAGEGILSSIPGVGTVASTALGGVGAARDVRRATKIGSKLTRQAKAAYKTARRAKTSKGKAFKTAGGVATGFKKSPEKFGVDTTSKYKRVKDYLFKDLPGTGTKKTKTKDLILGKTRFGRGARVQLAQDKIRKIIGGAAKRTGGDVGVVGRRSAGGFTAS